MDILTRISTFLLRMPPLFSVALIVAFSVLLSYGLGWLILDTTEMPEKDLSLVLALCIVVPILVATPVSAVIINLLHNLEDSRKEAVHLANTDILTGVLNRRRFFEVASKELALAHDTKSAITVLLLDVDDFKKVNDSYGHDAGDAVLKMVAEQCSITLRPGDSFARWGGEEFVAVLPSADPSESIGIALKVRDAIAAGSVDASGASISVTASIGIASETENSETLESLINRADHAMYEAKRTGKNAAVMAPTPDSFDTKDQVG